MTAIIRMPDGRKVNLDTNEGASAFFAYNTRFVSYFTDQAKEIMASDITGHGSRESTSRVSDLLELFNMLGAMAHSLRPDQLAKLDQDEFQCLVDFVNMRFTAVSGTTMWRSSGILSKPDQMLLFTILWWLKHSIFFKLMLASDGFVVIADLIARDQQGKPSMPDPEVTKTVLLIINACVICMHDILKTEETSITLPGMLMDLE